MSGINNINLIPKESSVPEYIRNTDAQLKKVAVLCLVLLVVGGTLTLGAYLTLQARHKILENSRARYLKELSAMSRKENIYLVIKNRLGMTTNVINSAQPLGTLINRTVTITPPPQLVSISYLLNGETSTNFEAGSIDEIAAIAGKYTDMTLNNEIKKTTLDNFSINELGYTAQFSFNNR